MTDNPWLWLALMIVGTFLLRAVPLVMVSRLQLPAPIVTWLGYAAESVLSSFMALFLFWDAAAGRFQFPAALVAATIILIAVQVWRRSVYTALVAGIASYALLSRLIG